MAKKGERVRQIGHLFASGPARFYTPAAIARSTGMPVTSANHALMDMLITRKVKQTEFMHGQRFGYAYGAPDTPDDAPVLVVQMQAVVVPYISHIAESQKVL